MKPRWSRAPAAALMLATSALAVTTTALLYRRFDATLVAAPRSPRRTTAAEAPALTSHHLPTDAAFTILVSSYPIGEPTTPADVAAMTGWLESSGFNVFHAEVDLGSRGRWQRVLAGVYADAESGQHDADRLRAAVPQSDARVVSAAYATGIVATSMSGGAAWPSGSEP